MANPQPTTADALILHRSVLRDGEGFDLTFEDWHTKHHFSVTGYLPPGTTKRAKSIAPHLRQPLRTMIGLVFDVHEMNYCLKESTFEVDNIVFSRHKLVFRKLYLESFSEAGCRKNLLSVKSFIETNFFGGFSVPNDAKHLLDLLASNPRDKRLLIYHHFALMNDISRKNFIDQSYQIQKQYDHSKRADYMKACARLSNKDDWATLWESESTLKYVHSQGKLMGLYENNLVDDQPRFFNHAVSDLILYCRKEDGEVMYTYDNCLDILLSIPEFAANIMRFAEYLNDFGLLETFKLENYFD